ncbi:SRPBCC family protein [Massilia consociata]|uniref:SRPBCC family protein n=1 Tax=Massilia consociata TaxID=760117 RepID=A0ABV6FIX9_9BURK
MEIVESILIEASPAAVFAIYADVARWPAWDPDTRAASIDGSFASGATGRLAPAKGFEVPMQFISVEPDRGFTVASRVLFSTMLFDHTLHPTGAGVVATHRVSFHGPCAWFLRHLVGRRVRHGLPVTMRRLKAFAEGRS